MSLLPDAAQPIPAPGLYRRNSYAERAVYLIVAATASAIGAADGAGVFPFFVGALALLVAFLLLARDLRRPRVNAVPVAASTPPA